VKLHSTICRAGVLSSPCGTAWRNMTASFSGPVTFLLLGLQTLSGQASSWLTDEQAREVAGATIRSAYPHPCYSTYRRERLEYWIVTLRRNPLARDRINDSVYFYNVASDSCDYVVEKDGKPIRMIEVSNDCCEYGLVAVDRVTKKSYWFTRENGADTFREFVRGEQIYPDLPQPGLFIALYRELAWDDSTGNEVNSLSQLRELVQQNFRSAYSPYERDDAWERKFERWWKHFRASLPKLDFEITFEPTRDGTKVRGYAFNGFHLTIPRSDPPPKGTPQLFQWILLVKSDGSVERLPSKIIYSAR
jgi:hypothetical protein